MSTVISTIDKKVSTGKPPVKKENYLRLVVEFVLASFLVLVVLEGVFAWAGIGEQECLRIDPEVGFSLFPGKHVTWRKEGFSRVKFNRFGMQDRDYSLEKPANTKRIAVIGDSYVEALQVDRDKNFCSLLERNLNKRSSVEPVEVMNFGIQAHNLSQTYLILRDRVLRFKPDVVVLPYRPEATFLLPPDLKSGFLSARPNFFADGKGGLIEDRTIQELWNKSAAGRRMHTTAWLREHSRIWGVIGQAMEAWGTWNKDGGLLKNFVNPVEKELPGPQQAALSESDSGVSGGRIEFVNTWDAGQKSIESTWPVADALISEIARLCRQNSCKLVILRMPGVLGHTSNSETDLLIQTANRNGLPFLDLTEGFHQALRDGGDKLFYNTHMTPAGHRLVAEHLSRKIESLHDGD